MKKFYCLLLSALATLPSAVQAQETKKEGWHYTAGAGLLFAPTYMGDDEYQLSALPNIEIKYSNKFSASVQNGARYNFLQNENWSIGPAARYDFGRDEDGDSTFGITDGTDDLRGLGDVDGTFEVGGFVEYRLRPLSAKLELFQGLGGHEGLIGKAGLSYGGRTTLAGRPFIYSIGPEISYADENYHESYFNVNTAQAAASGLSTYDADSDVLSYNFGGTGIMPLTENIAAVFITRYGRLGNQSADSSLVEERGSANQFTAGAFINYSF